MKPSTSAELHKTMTVMRGSGVAVSMIIGSGLLVLPGLAYARVGPAAVYAWLLAAAAIVPLLAVFTRLGCLHPNAGGVVGFAGAAYGRVGAAGAAYLLIGACAFGGAAMAITGGNYLAALIGDERAAVFVTFGYLVVTCSLNAMGSRLASGVQTVVIAVLVLLIALVAAMPFLIPAASRSGSMAPPDSWSAGLPALGIVFFAYTGWELVASTTEEYRNPRRDLPFVMGLSFAVVVLVYLAISVSVQLTLRPDDPLLARAPLVAVIDQTLGRGGADAVAVLGGAIIFTTLMGGTWATSRIVFATARENLLFQQLRRVHEPSGTPRPAIVLSAALFATVIGFHAVGLWPLDLVFKLSTVNFVVGYGVAACAYARLCRRWWERIVAVTALIPILILLAGFGWLLLFPLATLASGVLAHRLSRR